MKIYDELDLIVLLAQDCNDLGKFYIIFHFLNNTVISTGITLKNLNEGHFKLSPIDNEYNYETLMISLSSSNPDTTRYNSMDDCMLNLGNVKKLISYTCEY